MTRKARGLANIKTAQRCKIRAKPRKADTDYLDLFVLQKNRTRIEQEMRNLQGRLEELNEDIQRIDKAMTQISESAQMRPPAAFPDGKTTPPSAMKKMDLQY